MTALWVLACFFCYCAGSLAERTDALFGYWRAVKRSRPISSDARRTAAFTAITSFALFCLSALLALGCAFGAWWYQ